MLRADDTIPTYDLVKIHVRRLVAERFARRWRVCVERELPGPDGLELFSAYGTGLTMQFAICDALRNAESKAQATGV